MSLQLCNRVASWNHSSPQQNLPPLLYITTSCGGVHLGGTPSGVYPGFYITHFDLLLLLGKKGGELPRAKTSNSEVAICPATSHGNSQTSQVCPHFTKLPHFHLLSYQPLLFPWNTNPNSSPAMNDCIHRGEQAWESTHQRTGGPNPQSQQRPRPRRKPLLPARRSGLAGHQRIQATPNLQKN